MSVKPTLTITAHKMEIRNRIAQFITQCHFYAVSH